MTNTHTLIGAERNALAALCIRLDTPRSLGVYLRLLYDESQLASLDCDPLDFLSTDSEGFAGFYLISSFLSKWKGLVTGIDTRSVALKSFVDSEGICLTTNKKFRNLSDLASNTRLCSVLHEAQRKIARLLGPFSCFKVDYGCGWGKGASLGLPRKRAFRDLKLTALPISVSPHALSLSISMIKSDLHWSSALLNVSPQEIVGPFSFTRDVFDVRGYARLDTVPKNAKGDRSILVEPRMNGFLQKGAGSFIRERLRCVGINLNDQWYNQEGARKAFSEGLSTIDLKAASDTIALELVYQLLPVDWAIYLDSIRSKAYEHEGIVTRLEKFSSMGNGFTFELETLIFYAICSAASESQGCTQPILVYGDDIVCGREAANGIISILGECGFTCNSSKTFVEGCFFESCGRHYFAGLEVTPIYQKEKVDNEFENIRMANRLARCGMRYLSAGFSDKAIRSAHAAVLRYGSFTDCQIPFFAEGDDGYVKWDGADLKSSFEFDRNYGFKCHVVRRCSDVQLPGHEAALYALALRFGNGADPCYGNVSKPNESIRLVRGKRWFSTIGRWPHYCGCFEGRAP